MKATGENEGRPISQSKTLVPIEFTFGEAPVHAITRDTGEVWFVASDVCKVLGYRNPWDAIADLDDDERAVTLAETAGGAQETNIINESGVYHLIFRSRKSAAKGFRRWVTSEVLPEIRRTGQYERDAGQYGHPATPEQALILRLQSFVQEYVYFHFSLYSEERLREIEALPPPPERQPAATDSQPMHFENPDHQRYFAGCDLEIQGCIETLRVFCDLHLRDRSHMVRLMHQDPDDYLRMMQGALSCLMHFMTLYKEAFSEWCAPAARSYASVGATRYRRTGIPLVRSGDTLSPKGEPNVIISPCH